MRLLHEEFPIGCSIYLTFNDTIYSGRVLDYQDSYIIAEVPQLSFAPVSAKPSRCIRQAQTPSEERIEALQILLSKINQHNGIITHEELGPLLKELQDIVYTPRSVN